MANGNKRNFWSDSILGIVEQLRHLQHHLILLLKQVNFKACKLYFTKCVFKIKFKNSYILETFGTII